METIAIGSSEGIDEIRASLERQFRRAEKREGLQVGLLDVDRGHWRFVGCRLASMPAQAGGTDAVSAVRRCVADALGEVICGHWEERLVRRLIRAHYDYFDAEEQGRIFGYASHRLREADATRGAGISRRARVLARLQEYLDAHNNLILDGFVTFRLKDYMEELEETVDRAVDEYLLEREFEEFVHLLRHFVESQEPRVDTVHVVRLASGSFQILGVDGSVLRADALTGHAPGAPGPEIDGDDVLISALVTMAPRTIHLHRLSERADLKDAVETLRRVFPARLRECAGCPRCRERRRPREVAGEAGQRPR